MNKSEPDKGGQGKNPVEEDGVPSRPSFPAAAASSRIAAKKINQSRNELERLLAGILDQSLGEKSSIDVQTLEDAERRSRLLELLEKTNPTRAFFHFNFFMAIIAVVASIGCVFLAWLPMRSAEIELEASAAGVELVSSSQAVVRVPRLKISALSLEAMKFNSISVSDSNDSKSVDWSAESGGNVEIEPATGMAIPEDEPASVDARLKVVLPSGGFGFDSVPDTDGRAFVFRIYGIKSAAVVGDATRSVSVSATTYGRVDLALQYSDSKPSEKWPSPGKEQGSDSKPIVKVNAEAEVGEEQAFLVVDIVADEFEKSSEDEKEGKANEDKQEGATEAKGRKCVVCSPVAVSSLKLVSVEEGNKLRCSVKKGMLLFLDVSPEPRKLGPEDCLKLHVVNGMMNRLEFDQQEGVFKVRFRGTVNELWVGGEDKKDWMPTWLEFLVGNRRTKLIVGAVMPLIAALYALYNVVKGRHG